MPTQRLAISLAVLLAAAPASAAETPPKRPVPDYDGTGRRDRTTASDVLLWLPRTPMLPLYAVTEFGLRTPLGALTRTAEKHHWAGALYDFFTSDDRKVGILPSAFFDFGTRPSVGFFFFWNDAIAAKNDVRFHLGTWGPTWLNVTALDRYTFAPNKTLNLRAAFSRRRDLYFNGLGPESTPANQSRYEVNRLDVGPSIVIDGWRLSALRVAAGLRRVDFGEGGCCSDPTLRDRVADGAFPLPPQFGNPYTSVYQRVQVVVDSRRPAPEDGNGVRAEVYAEPAFHPRPLNPQSWVRYGATIGPSIDLTGHQRILSLTVAADFADTITGPEVPFNEQVTLGGGQTPAGSFVETKMRGFRYGRLVGRSAAVATLQYTWPIWFMLDGIIQVATGNVFGPALRDFDADLLRMSGVIGVRTNQQRDAHFSVLFGAGTETFRQGFALEDFRLAIGTTHGF